MFTALRRWWTSTAPCVESYIAYSHLADSSFVGAQDSSNAGCQSNYALLGLDPSDLTLDERAIVEKFDAKYFSTNTLGKDLGD